MQGGLAVTHLLHPDPGMKIPAAEKHDHNPA
jgi:hypothetical protein